MFNVAAADNPKRRSMTVWGIDRERGFDSGSFYSSGGASGSGASGSEIGLAPLSKSPNSASISSSSIGDGKTSKPVLEGSEAIQDNFYSGKPFTKAKLGSTSALEASVGSGEQLLSLKLGKRAYFEDVGTGSNAKSSSIPVAATSSVSSTKRSKSSSQGTQAPRCQVEGCNLDLSSAKNYHRKHKVCESHSKCPKVVVAGLERRFCQQCSRFHELSEFDEKKRSCRRRLSDHNARRRKPQPESVQLNAARMSASYYGLEDSIITSSVDANQDLHRALSLLSTNSWDLSESKSTSLEQPVHAIHKSVPQSVLHAIPPGLPLTPSGSWRPGYQSNEAQVQTFASANDCGNYFQEFQFPRTFYESDFDPTHLN